jgi:hypothetical protein
MIVNRLKTCVLLLSLCCCVFSLSWAQDKAFQIDFEKNDRFEDAIYSHTNGAWIMVKQQSALKKNVEFKIVKYSPDFATKEWEKSIKMGSWSGFAIYYKQNPSYLYYFDEAMGVTIMNKIKLSFQQISPKGEMKTRELADDKSMKKLLMGWCDSLHFYQLGTQDNPGDFTIVKYAHDTWKHSKITLKMPAQIGGIKPDAEWHLAGRLDKTISFIRYGEKKEEGSYQVATFDIETGKIVHQFAYKYGVEIPEPTHTSHFRYDYGDALPSRDSRGKFCNELDTKTVGASNNSGEALIFTEVALGNISPAPDGKHYYFICTVNHNPPKIQLGAAPQDRSDGILLVKIDQTGKQVWKQIIKFTEGEAGGFGKKNIGIISNSPFATELSLTHDAQNSDNLVVKLKFAESSGMMGATNIRTLSYLLDGSGKKLKTFQTDTEVIDKIIRGREKLTSANAKDLAVAFRPTLSEAIKTYFLKKGLPGYYLLERSGNSAALFITPEETKNALGVVYFKDIKEPK